MSIQLRHGYRGPADHSGGNSIANSWAVAASSGRAMADEAEIGDTLSYDDAEAIGECVFAEFAKALRANGLCVIDDSGDGWLIAELS